MKLYGTLHEQLARCEAEIEECERKMADPHYPYQLGAFQGWADQCVNRLRILEEIDAEIRGERAEAA